MRNRDLIKHLETLPDNLYVMVSDGNICSHVETCAPTRLGNEFDVVTLYYQPPFPANKRPAESISEKK